MKTLALALGGGGARGLAHIAVLEALDEIGARPVAIAGTSVGALVGAAYASGMSGRRIRRFVTSLAYDRAEVFRRLVATRAGSFGDLFSTGFVGATLAECREVLRAIPSGRICARASASSRSRSPSLPPIFIAAQQVAFSAGPLAPALAASIALPTLMRPVVVDSRVLIDGGATNPLPFDQLWGRADILLAVDVSGEPQCAAP